MKATFFSATVFSESHLSRVLRSFGNDKFSSNRRTSFHETFIDFDYECKKI